ncbi:hypothetical protein L0F63_000649 [Massospora cicadina]|nr:hypothetical protein L0F63_000649 [Massospora cicadina]
MLQAKNIKVYSEYLENKVLVYQTAKVDFAESRSGRGMRLMNETVGRGLIKNITLIQDHLEVLLRTKYHESDIDNHVVLHSFKMLIRDLLKVFQCVNQGIISILKSYFELGKDEASICLALYRRFISQTEQVISYLDSARNLETLLQFTVPQLKHAPVSLLESLEEYLKSLNSVSTPTLIAAEPPYNKSHSVNKSAKKKDAIDFFASLDDEMALQNYLPPTPHINIGSPSLAGSYLSSNPFAPAMQRARSPFDAPWFNQPRSQSTAQSSRFNFQPSTHPSHSSFQSAAQSGTLNPFSQAPSISFVPSTSFVPSHARKGSLGLNPFMSTQAFTQPQQAVNSLHQTPIFSHNRNTMNPFAANSFGHASQQPQPSSSFDFATFRPQTTSSPFQTTPQTGLQTPAHSDLSKLFSQHTFPAQ